MVRSLNVVKKKFQNFSALFFLKRASKLFKFQTRNTDLLYRSAAPFSLNSLALLLCKPVYWVKLSLSATRGHHSFPQQVCLMLTLQEPHSHSVILSGRQAEGSSPVGIRLWKGLHEWREVLSNYLSLLKETGSIGLSYNQFSQDVLGLVISPLLPIFTGFIALDPTESVNLNLGTIVGPRFIQRLLTDS